MNLFSNKNNKISIENLLPHNFLAEKMILSSIIVNPELLETTTKNLTVETFYFKNHQELYRTILKMNNRELPIDIVTVTIFLQENGLIAQIGGIKVLLDLGNQTPTMSYIDEYTRIIKEKFLKRCLIKFGYQLINSGYLANQSLENIIIQMEQELFNLTNQIQSTKTQNMAEILNELFDDLKEKFLNPQLPGLPSGFFKLDELTQGFQKSDLIILAGRPSMGKTSLGLNIALNSLKLSELPILFCSLEMSKEQILYRLLSTETGINQMKLKSGELTQNNWIKLNKIIRLLARLPLFIDDNSNLSVQEIKASIKSLLLKQNQIGLVVIDYLQLLKSLDSSQGNRVQELSQITRDLKNLAKEFNIPIIALSQLSRNVDNRTNQRPLLSDLRESGSIEQDADIVLFLYRSKTNTSIVSSLSVQEQEPHFSVTELIIAKQRNGPRGTVFLKFNEDQIKFSDF